MYSLRFKINVTFGHKVCNEIKVTFGEISLKLSQTNWNVARNNVNVVADELASLLSVYTCLTIDIWTRRRWRTSMRFYALWCHPPKMAGFQWNWRQKFSTLLWTPLARQKALSEPYNAHNFVLKVQKMTLSQWIFWNVTFILKRRDYQFALKLDLGYFMYQILGVLVLRVESNFLRNPTFNTNPKPHLQKALPCRQHPCRTWA